MSPPGPAVTAIVVTHDSAHVLPGWIEALEATGERERLELCVVDSGSTAKQLRAMREQAADRVDTFLVLPNVGYGAACNAGASAARGRTLLFTNPDVEVLSLPPRTLDERGLGDVLVSGFATEPERPLGFARLPGWSEEAQELALGRWSRAYGRTSEKPAWVSGAALMLNREAFERIGGFSPAFFMYFEDADICARHRCAGGRVELDHDLVLRHRSGESSGAQGRTIAGALDGVGRLSARRFAARYGRPWQRPLLYALLATFYLPRRVLARLIRERRLDATVQYAIYLLFPKLALRRLLATTSPHHVPDRFYRAMPADRAPADPR
jgi:N-acetylglucosaminyl-diphospho-decaprenol L-rhamnosyltransferase